jgi:hypothetical protein
MQGPLRKNSQDSDYFELDGGFISDFQEGPFVSWCGRRGMARSEPPDRAQMVQIRLSWLKDQ